MYDALLKEYRTLQSKKSKMIAELAVLARGSISVKTIKGNEYYYLQCRNGGHVVSRYLKSDEITPIKKDLAKRKRYEKELTGIDLRLGELEYAGRLIGRGLVQQMLRIKLASGMDSLSSVERQKAVSFGVALNAVEGIPATEQSASEVAAWCSGATSYLAAFDTILKRYGFSTGGASHA